MAGSSEFGEEASDDLCQPVVETSLVPRQPDIRGRFPRRPSFTERSQSIPIRELARESLRNMIYLGKLQPPLPVVLPFEDFVTGKVLEYRDCLDRLLEDSILHDGDKPILQETGDFFGEISRITLVRASASILRCH